MTDVAKLKLSTWTSKMVENAVFHKREPINPFGDQPLPQEPLPSEAAGYTPGPGSGAYAILVAMEKAHRDGQQNELRASLCRAALLPRLSTSRLAIAGLCAVVAPLGRPQQLLPLVVQAVHQLASARQPPDAYPPSPLASPDNRGHQYVGTAVLQRTHGVQLVCRSQVRLLEGQRDAGEQEAAEQEKKQ